MLSSNVNKKSLKDYFDLLQTKYTPQINWDDIKAGYRKASRKWHPDRNKDNPVAPEKLAEVQNAYKFLSKLYEKKYGDLTTEEKITFIESLLTLTYTEQKNFL